jgi:predicted kinase
MLISLGGLPGIGKTTIAFELARQIRAVHVRIDSIEQAIRDSGIIPESREPDHAGYRVAYAVAEDNLKLGQTVIADCVNPLPLTRNAWLEAAKTAGVRAIEIEVVCSDATEHRQRVETRTTTIRGLRLPTWQEVVDRDYRKWDRERIVIDTARQTVGQAVRLLRHAIDAVRQS